MKGVIGSDCIAIKLDGDRSEVKDRLNQLRRELESEFDISDNEDIIWEEARDKFICEINGDVSIKNENISAIPALITKEMKQLLKKVADAPGGQILITSDRESGTYIQIGSEVVAKEYPDRREYAVWEEALNACSLHFSPGNFRGRNRCRADGLNSSSQKSSSIISEASRPAVS